MVSPGSLVRVGSPAGAPLRADEWARPLGYLLPRAGRMPAPVADGAVAVAADGGRSPDTHPRIVVDQPRDVRELERIRVDQATMAAIAAGDDQAFARLVVEMSPLLLRFARSVLDSAPDDADEV